MAKTVTSDDTYTDETPAVSEAAAATRAAIADRPRQSVIRYVQYFVTIKETAPERLEEFFTPEEIDELEGVAEAVSNPVQDAVEKATAAQLDQAVRALTNEDEKNGYAHYTFDSEIFAEKTRVKNPRSRKSVTEKVEDVLAGASEEDIAALKELLAARGL